jgi:hypothetical protein
MTPVSPPPPGQPLIPPEEALRVARLDAERVYRDLSPFRVIVSREDDGWHVDYHLKDPRLNGGGPQYVIDAMTGVIVSKCYYQ